MIPSADAPVARARVEIRYERGLHARPATLIAERARRFHADVTLVLLRSPIEISTPPGTRADAKNVMDIMFLAAPQGTELEIEARGPDAQPALEALTSVLLDGAPLFGAAPADA